MRAYHIAILGECGAVGKEICQILEERDLPIASLKLLASKRSAGEKILFRDEVIVIEEVNAHSFQGMDLVFGAVDEKTAKRFLPYAISAGALVIDNSSAYRLKPQVPLVIPQINPEDIKKHQGLIANPNCTTIIALMAAAPLHRLAKIKSMVVSTYQAVSGAGHAGMEELKKQMQAELCGEALPIQVFPYPIAYNLIPQIGDFDESGYSSEEWKLQREGRKILHEPNLCVTCTCVRLPIMRAHSEAITLFFEDAISVEAAKAALKESEGVVLLDEKEQAVYPMPLFASGKDDIYVGRVRASMHDQTHSLTLWCCGDQLRKGAALNAVQIAEAAIELGAL